MRQFSIGPDGISLDASSGGLSLFVGVVNEVPTERAKKDKPMDPFRSSRQVIPAAGRHCRYGRCAVCRSQPVHVRREFADLIRRSWSPGETDMPGKAARSALL
jgi:hypothetical protein